eukprot:11293_4
MCIILRLMCHFEFIRFSMLHIVAKMPLEKKDLTLPLLFCFVLFCFVLFCFVLFCFVLFCFVLFNTIQIMNDLKTKFVNLRRAHTFLSKDLNS